LEIRSRIVGVLEKSLPKEQAALLNGMLIGYTKGMDEKMTGAFSDAGLTHVMAVSGMNVAFIVFPLIFLFKKMRIGQTPANFVIIGVLILFVFVTGFSPSVLRAVIMAVIMLTAQIIKRQTDVITSISFAAILLLLYNPYTLFDIGFQLSFTATLSLVLFYKYIKELLSFKHIPGFISDVLSATLAAQIGTIPITAFYFNKISIISLASNLIVVPLVEVITIIGTIMALAGQFSTEVSQVIGYVDCTFLTFILYVTKISSKVPFAVVRVVTPPLYAVFLYYVASLFFVVQASI
jgi:competence protein ComEC